jgi:hypothetical protein
MAMGLSHGNDILEARRRPLRAPAGQNLRERSNASRSPGGGDIIGAQEPGRVPNRSDTGRFEPHDHGPSRGSVEFSNEPIHESADPTPAGPELPGGDPGQPAAPGLLDRPYDEPRVAQHDGRVFGDLWLDVTGEGVDPQEGFRCLTSGGFGPRRWPTAIAQGRSAMGGNDRAGSMPATRLTSAAMAGRRTSRRSPAGARAAKRSHRGSCPRV